MRNASHEPPSPTFVLGYTGNTTAEAASNGHSDGESSAATVAVPSRVTRSKMAIKEKDPRNDEAGDSRNPSAKKSLKRLQIDVLPSNPCGLEGSIDIDAIRWN